MLLSRVTQSDQDAIIAASDITGAIVRTSFMFGDRKTRETLIHCLTDQAADAEPEEAHVFLAFVTMLHDIYESQNQDDARSESMMLTGE